MIKYSKDGKACYLAGTFNFGEKILARVISVYGDEVKIMPFEKWNKSDFTISDVNKDVQESKKPIETVNVEKLEEALKEEVELTSRTIRAITPKGKEVFTKEDELSSFCEKYKLDIEAVQLVLDGVQKTHRKWGFELVE